MAVGKGYFVLFLVVAGFVLPSCNVNKFEVLKEGAAVEVPIINKVSKESYLNGQKFCEKYVNTGSPLTKEDGKWIEAPFSYENPTKTVKIYAYTKKAFDPNLPTFIIVDGGPGQNTHGYPDIFANGFNEIRFDQRGVGCSAPSTWEEYIDHELYSSLNTAQDIDEIRKAYGLKTVSLYGISYGTVPSTIYANKFESTTKSLVIEGVVGKIENFSRYSFEVEKYNLVIDSLNNEQKDAFNDVLYGNDKKKLFVVYYFLQSARYQDGGFRIVKDLYFKKLFPEAGGIDEGAFKRAHAAIQKYENPYDTPQHPGAVDENVLIRFYCKELGGFSKDKFYMSYNRARGFFEEVAKDKETWANECGAQGITLEMENLYDERSYPTGSPVYYFQGSHDGATVADGALNHWKSVPKNKSYFLLSLKGGHNPAISKTRSADSEISKMHKELFTEALSANTIGYDFVKKLNAAIVNSTHEEEKKFNYNTWELYTSNKASFSDIEKEFKGLRRLNQSK